VNSILFCAPVYNCPFKRINRSRIFGRGEVPSLIFSAPPRSRVAAHSSIESKSLSGEPVPLLTGTFQPRVALGGPNSFSVSPLPPPKVAQKGALELKSRLAEKLKRIAAQRAELDDLERTTIEDMLREEKDYQNLASANLEQVIISPETIIQSVAATERELNREIDYCPKTSKGQVATEDLHYECAVVSRLLG
jgi:hypothetical protein